MMNNFTQDELNALSAPFPVDMHTVREGHRNKAKTKIRWFAYIPRSIVQRRLNEIFPDEWQTTEPKLYTLGSTISATVGITIRGITRWDGGDDDTGEGSKGALTNAFRRTAAYGWDIALYLYEMDFQIWTDSYPDGDWDMQKKRQQEAFDKFTQWYNSQFPIMPQKQAPQVRQDAPVTPKAQSQPKAQETPVTPVSSGSEVIPYVAPGAKEWWPTLYQIITPMYDNPKHAVNSAQRLAKSGAINVHEMTVAQAVEVIRKHLLDKSAYAEASMEEMGKS